MEVSRNRVRAIGAALVISIFVGYYLIYETDLGIEKTSGVELDIISQFLRPQDDFYTYANEGWLEKTEVNDDRPYQDNITQIQGLVYGQIQDIVDNTTQLEFFPPGVQLTYKEVKLFYETFLNESARDEREFSDLVPVFEAIDALKNHQDIFTFFAKAQRLGIDAPVMAYPQPDEKDPVKQRLHLWQHGLGLQSKGLYLSSKEVFVEMRREYLAYIEQIMKALNVEHPAEAAKAVLILEMRLATHQMEDSYFYKPSKLYHFYTQEQLKQSFESLNWGGYFKELGIDTPEALIISQPSYVQAIESLLLNIPASDWKAYLKYQTVHAYAPYLHQDMVSLHDKFFHKHFKQYSDGVDPALVALNQVMPFELSQLYEILYLNPAVLERVTDIFENIKTVFIRKLKHINWMTTETRKEAQKKVRQVKLIHMHNFEDMSSGLGPKQINDPYDSLVTQVMQLHKRSFARGVRKLRQKKSMYPEFYAQDVDLTYHPELNAVVVPIAVLQAPLFHESADEAANYGSIGVLLAHQIGRSFGLQGASFDEKGVLSSWWTEKDYELFNNMRAPLIDQYESYEPVDGIRIQGKQTLDENTLDVLALNLAYAAFTDLIKDEHIYIIDELSAYQRFFLSYAQAMRRKETNKSLINHLYYGRYAPAKYRVNGALSQSAGFNRTFRLQEGDGLFLPEVFRIRLWR